MKRSGKISINTLIFVLLFLGSMVFESHAQNQCTVSVSMINHNRYAYETDEECSGIHSVPWGNWGISSNVGSKQDADQFKGWRQPCSYTKVEWNSCAANESRPNECYRLNLPDPSGAYPYPANGYPYSDSYAWNDWVPPYGPDICVDQYSPCGFNGYGGTWIGYWVNSPRDYDCDGIFDSGGCLDLNGSAFTVQNNFMTAYELDPWDDDELVQTVYFPNVSVTLNCDVYGCTAVGDNNYDGWLDDVSNQFSAEYKWPTSYQDDWGVTCYPGNQGVPCKRIDATIRIGFAMGYLNGNPCDPSCDPSCQY